MHKGVFHHIFGEAIGFWLSWELPIKQQISNLQKRTLISQDFNRIPSILKDSPISIDKSDCRGASDGVHVTSIISSQNFPLVG